MKTLLGSQEKRDRKFIPELYVASKKLKVALADFLGSDKPAFAIIGESGSGKTCSMCGLALELTRQNPILFYRAVNLTEGLIKSISNDFNWEFSAHYDEITLFKRLDKIFKGKGGMGDVHKIIKFRNSEDWVSALHSAQVLAREKTK